MKGRESKTSLGEAPPFAGRQSSEGVSSPKSLHGHALRKIARLVNVASSRDGDVVG